MPVGSEALEPVGAPRDEVDPELVALPEPPRGERKRTLLLVAVTAVACLAMAAGLGREALYALRAAPRPAELADLRVLETSSLVEDQHVCAHGGLGAAGAVRFERPFEQDSYRVAPVVGRTDVWVEVRVPSGLENGRWVPPTSFCGRLVRFENAGMRRRGLASAVETATGKAVPAGAFLLIDGEDPAHARGSVALVALFVVFGAWNLLALARLGRRLDAAS